MTIIPPIITPSEIKKTTKIFVHVNKNPIKFKGEAKTEKSKEILPILITENKNIQPLLGLDWLDKLEIGLQGSKKTNVIRHVEEDERKLSMNMKIYSKTIILPKISQSTFS